MKEAPKALSRTGRARLPTRHGAFQALTYRYGSDPVEHVALVMGDVRGAADVLTRVHSECLTGDAFGSCRCDCGPQLDRSMAMIAAAGRGVVVYLRGHEGRGIGLSHKLRAYQLQDQGFDTVDANLKLGFPVDMRNYDAAVCILLDMGLTTVRLLTNNPDKVGRLEHPPLHVVERIPLQIPANPDSIRYLRAKQQRLGHLLDLDAPRDPKPD